MGVTLGKKMIAIVGTGLNASYPSTKIVFWDCDKNNGHSELNNN
jgi:hypothetical protein